MMAAYMSAVPLLVEGRSAESLVTSEIRYDVRGKI